MTDTPVVPSEAAIAAAHKYDQEHVWSLPDLLAAAYAVDWEPLLERLREAITMYDLLAATAGDDMKPYWLATAGKNLRSAVEALLKDKEGA